MKQVIAWLERKNIIGVRSVMLYATVWLTWDVLLKMTLFATTSKFDGVGTAAIIAAITAPVTALQAFAFKIYSESRK